MKKKVSLCFWLSFLGTIAYAQSSKFSLNGTVEGADKGYLILTYYNEQEKQVTDTINLKGNKFFYSGMIKHHQIATLRGQFEPKSDPDLNRVWYFLESKSMEIKLTKDNFSSIIVSGTKLNDQKQAQNFMKRENDLAANTTYEELLKWRSKKENVPADLFKKKADSLNARLSHLLDIGKKMDLAYIRSNPAAEYSAFLMDYYFETRKLTLDSAQMIINKFSPQVRESYFGKQIAANVKARKASLVGEAAPAFSTVDIRGKAINLEQFKGKKFVLLDFWASWCLPCREENPRLIKIYERYKEKDFEIVSVSWDTKQEPWKKAIEKDGTGAWRHVLGSLSEPDDASMRGRYSIKAIPTLVLVDKGGKIIGRYRGSEEEGSMKDLENELARVFAKE